MFVDYAGQTIDLTDGRTGEIRPAQILVAVMGYRACIGILRLARHYGAERLESGLQPWA